MNITTSTLNIYLTDTDKIGEQIMSAASTILAKIEENRLAQAAAIARVAEDVEFLKSKVVDGTHISVDDLNTITSGLDRLTSQLATLDPVPDNPTPGLPDPPPAPPE